jgi:D-alanyl-D-alanine carboxypeptidase (penicillin-binding protein 5/6)
MLLVALTLPVNAGPGLPEGMELDSPSAVLMDAGSGQFLVAHNPDEPRAPASLTKIMTLALAFEAIKEGRASLDDMVVVSPEAASYGGTTIFLEVGERIPLRDLLLGIAVASGNDASVAVAEYLGGSEEAFVHMMNEKARALGMENTLFRNPHGLDEEGHYTTARDTAILCRYATTFPGLLEMTRIYEEYLRDGATWLVNRNRLVIFYDGADGLKTGHTSLAKYCLAATAKRDNLRLVSVVLGADTSDMRFQDTRALLNYGFAHFQAHPVASEGDAIRRVKVWLGVSEEVDALAGEDLALTLPKGRDVTIEQRVEVLGSVLAPLKRGEPLGELVISVEGQDEARVTLVAAEDVPRVTLFPLAWRYLQGLWAFP